MKKMMKRAIPFLMTLVVIVSVLPTTALAHHGKGGYHGAGLPDYVDGACGGCGASFFKHCESDWNKLHICGYCFSCWHYHWFCTGCVTSTPNETPETPAAGETTETPAAGETTETPAAGETTETPTAGETTETPTADETTETPAAGETTESPVIGETTETPAAGETTETPATGETTETPESDTADDNNDDRTDDMTAGELVELIDEEVPLGIGTILNTEDAIAYLTGYEDGTVRPNDYITRAQVAVIFYRLMTEEFRTAFWTDENDFSDVSADSWYNEAVSTAVNAGIFGGYDDGTFRPGNYITRAEFASIAASFLGEEYEGEDLFDDISTHWARESINCIAAAGWVVEADDSFRPKDNITRAEVASIINMMLERSTDTERYGDDMKTFTDNMDTEVWYYGHIQAATNG